MLIYFVFWFHQIYNGFGDIRSFIWKWKYFSNVTLVGEVNRVYKSRCEEIFFSTTVRNISSLG